MTTDVYIIYMFTSLTCAAFLSEDVVTSRKKTSAGVRLEGTLVPCFLSVVAMAAFTSSRCLLWWFFSATAADSFSACSHSNSRVAMGDERVVVEVSRSRSPV